MLAHSDTFAIRFCRMRWSVTRPRVLVVDDDPSVRGAVADFLTANGFDFVIAADALEAEEALAASRIDAVLLDVMLPGEDGLSMCRRLADAGPPIIMVSAMGSTIDRIVGLELGAADYLAKPFEPRELLARLRSVLRQRSGRARPETGAEALLFAGLRYDVAASRLSTLGGEHVVLTAGELALVEAFVTRPGRLLGRETLMDITHGEADGPFDRAIDLAVSRLRRKLREAGASACIETVRGAGYRFVAPVVRA